MSIFNNWGNSLFSLFHQFKTQRLAWQLTHYAEQQHLKTQQFLNEQQLVIQLKKCQQQLAHELEIAETGHQAELNRLKTQYQHNIQDYKQYLQSLDELKLQLQKSYQHLPAALVFTIHHHAKQLLNQMWETENTLEKIQLETQLMQFMLSIHQDAQLAHPDQSIHQLPEKTLALLNRS
ncbi:MAG: hypothetical protein RL637_1140 [Pseudomonadota bacterium]|jgi:hypothetical protein